MFVLQTGRGEAMAFSGPRHHSAPQPADSRPGERAEHVEASQRELRQGEDQGQGDHQEALGRAGENQNRK